ncbi:hypothetical protein SAY86_015957 [Trapa natans]|uniref:Pentatricopeptide repeat-containing protein n=1 Tax=Trapa natans TaxID=22666 RepID=A0AAN7LIT5_TRANT|nr:hypothetical protein SAY86_015957 [Trapa natans]
MMMLCLRKLGGIEQQIQFNRTLQRLLSMSFPAPDLAVTASEIERITTLINDLPFPHQPLQPILEVRMSSHSLSNPLVEEVLGRLFAAHSNGLKALEFFHYSAKHLPEGPSADAFEKTLHILTRMRYFSQAWDLMEHVKVTHPSLLTLKSMSILLSRIAKFQSYEETLQAFDKMEKSVFVGRKFGTEEFNVLLRAFCTQRMMKEARAVFNNLYSRFSPDIKSANILLLGFKESGDITAVELFYHEMVRRGFKPNPVTYDIRIDAYCKKGCLGDALRLFEEMEKLGNFKPTIKTITTLIHGAGVAQNPRKAWDLFDSILSRNMKPDVGAYNSLISSMVKCRDAKAALHLMKEMEEKQIEPDNVTYHTVFLGLIRLKGIESVCDLYSEMIEKNFVPKTRTVVMLMKFFCVNRRIDMGMSLWEYITGKGQCPHSHALDLLVTGLCSRGRLLEAFDCSKQMMERGRQMSELAYRMLFGSLYQAGELEKLKLLDGMVNKLVNVLPPSKGHARGMLNQDVD